MTRRYTDILFITFLFACLAACGGTGNRITTSNEKKVDFSGSWELDYSQSDNIQAKLNGMVRELRRDAERRAKAQGGNRSGAAVALGNGSIHNSGASIMGLAQMADLITQSQLLEVTQKTHDISIKREENFALECEFHPGQSTLVEHPLGTEFCGWDGHQLVFRVMLPDGLNIQHRLTLGPSGERLLITTILASSQVSYPISLNRVYNRFDPAETGYHCKQTLTKGRVCTTESR